MENKAQVTQALNALYQASRKANLPAEEHEKLRTYLVFLAKLLGFEEKPAG